MYKEIFKLAELLTKAAVPFDYNSHTYRGEQFYQICYPTDARDNVRCSVIETPVSYGNDDDRLEISGLLTEEERRTNDVVGWLTAEDVFRRITVDYKDYQKECVE